MIPKYVQNNITIRCAVGCNRLKPITRGQWNHAFQLVWSYSLKTRRHELQHIPVKVQLEQAGCWAQQEQLQAGHLVFGVEPYAPQRESKWIEDQTVLYYLKWPGSFICIRNFWEVQTLGKSSDSLQNTRLCPIFNVTHHWQLLLLRLVILCLRAWHRGLMVLTGRGAVRYSRLRRLGFGKDGGTGWSVSHVTGCKRGTTRLNYEKTLNALT